jgi:hypothetical protein
MATNPDDIQDDDVLELTDEMEDEAEQPDEQQEQPEDEEEYPSFDGEPPTEEQETDLVKHLRRENRQLQKRVAEQSRSQQEEPIVVGARPKLEDFDFDSEAHDKALDEYEERKEAKRQQDLRIEAAKDREAQTWRQVEQNYQAKRAALPYRDKDEVERQAFDVLTPAHQALIADIAPDPALFIYAAGKNPGRLTELAGYDMSDPRQVVKLAAAVGRMGASLTMKKRAKPPAPQAVVRGGVARQGSDKELERLEKEADKTGDRTALINYRRSLKQA